MDDPDQKPDLEAKPIVLHLNKFSPRPTESPTPAAPGVDEGATMFIRRAAAETVEQSATPVVVPRDSGTLPPKNLLGVIAYCYAKGVYRSEDIERELLADPELRATIGDEVPSAAAIRRFRRLNRAALEATLQKFYTHERHDHTPPLADDAPAPQAGEGTVRFVKREATERLDQAVIIDNLSRED